MAERKHTHGLSTRFEGQLAVVHLGHKQIWDGADLSLLRDALRELVEQKGYSSVGIDLTAVEFLPSGFFGHLMDWHDRGVALHIVGPHERVQNMLWFQRFFVFELGDHYRLESPEDALGIAGEAPGQSGRQLSSAISAELDDIAGKKRPHESPFSPIPHSKGQRMPAKRLNARQKLCVDAIAAFSREERAMVKRLFFKPRTGIPASQKSNNAPSTASGTLDSRTTLAEGLRCGSLQTVLEQQ